MRIRLAMVHLLALVYFSGTAWGQLFVFDMAGSQEVPPAGGTFTGGCLGDLDVGLATLDITCVHNVADATLVHIHQAAAGANGPIVFDMGTPVSPVQATWTGMTAGEIADLLGGGLYVNIHSTGRPGGAVRGQIVDSIDVEVFVADGSQQVPPDFSGTSGNCTADLSVDATSLTVSCTHDVVNPTVAHIHQGPPGENGPVIFDFGTVGNSFMGVVPMTPADVAAYAAKLLYVNIHSTDSPGGEIRGQMGTFPTGPTTGTVRIKKLSFPAGGTGFDFTDDIPGSGAFMLDDGQTEEFLNLTPGTYTVTESDPQTTPGGFFLTNIECDDDSATNVFTRTATIGLQAGEVVTCTFENTQAAAGDLFVFKLHGGQEVPPNISDLNGGCLGQLDQGTSTFTIFCSHNVAQATVMHIHGAPPGQNGSVVFDLGDPTSPVQAQWTGMTAGEIADLLAGNLYVNVHTAARPGGEIRGQIVERAFDNFSFPVNGAQQVPPDLSSATGTCTADLSDDAGQVSVECTHNVVDATAAHIHDAPAGANGPVLIDLGSPASPFSLMASLSPRDVARFAGCFLYVNIHSVESPPGEIRGQIAPQAVTVTEVDPGLARVGDQITIRGSGFSAGNVAVFFGVIRVTGVQVINDSTLIVTIPPQPLGPVNITVTTQDGSANLTGGLQLVAAIPTLSEWGFLLLAALLLGWTLFRLNRRQHSAAG